MNARKPPNFAPEELQKAQTLIETRLHAFYTEDEVIRELVTKEGIPPQLTQFVWRLLEKQNAEFFTFYALMLRLKKQIQTFNKFTHEQSVLAAQNLASLQSHVSAEDPRVNPLPREIPSLDRNAPANFNQLNFDIPDELFAFPPHPEPTNTNSVNDVNNFDRTWFDPNDFLS